MKVTIKNLSLPLGLHICTFEGIEVTSHLEYGPGWRWIFEVAQGNLKGKQCFRTTKDTPTPNNSCGYFLASLAGEIPRENLEIDPDEYVGRRYSVMVESTASGTSTRVASFTPITDGATDESAAPVARAIEDVDGAITEGAVPF